MKFSRPLFLALGLLTLAGCGDLFTSTMRPDYTIRVTPTAEGSIATPPNCPSWSDEAVHPFDNQPMPQFGCAHARNLANMIDDPNDLVEGRTLGNARSITAIGSIRRYDNDQPRGLIMPVSETSQIATSTAPTASSAMSGDIAGNSGSSSSAGASASGP